jgi:tetratricopeptide (TPR) repeat protein
MPRLASGLGLLLGTLAGGCLGWLLAVELRPEPADSVLVPATPPPADGGAAAPWLSGVARAAAPGAEAGGKDAGPTRRQVSLGDAADVAPLLALDGNAIPEARGREVVRALALLYATLGRPADFERLVARCIEVGWGAGDLLPLVELLPTGERLASVDRLLGGAFQGAAIDSVLLAGVLVQAGSRERAVALLQKDLEAGANQNAALKLIEIDPAAAAARLAAVPWLDAAETDLLSSVAAAFARAGTSDLAWPFLERILARGQFPATALDQLEEIDPRLGLQVAERALAPRRDEYQAWAWLGRMRLAQGDKAGAFDAYREGLGRNVNKEGIEQLIRVDVDRAYELVTSIDTSALTGDGVAVLATLALHRGTTEEAFAALARGLETEATEYSLLNAIVRVDPVRAAETLAAQVARYEGGGKDELVGAYANALRLSGRVGEARAAYLEAMALDASDAEWIDGLMQIDAPAALEHLERVRQGNDDEEWWQRATAEALGRTGRRAEAQAIYARLGGASAAASLGRWDPAEGRRRFEQLLRNEPKNASIWGQLGELERDLGNLAGARRAFSEAVALDPTSLWYVVRLRHVSADRTTPGAEPR